MANIYLHRLDAEVRSAGFRLIRYCDDFVILTATQVEARAADAFVRHIVADMGLEVAEAKSGVKKVNEGFEFLGFTVLGRYLRPRPAALARFKDQIRALTRRTAPVPIRQMINGLNPTIRGWGNYFAIGSVVSLFGDLDKWIRMRLRSKLRKRFKSKVGIDHYRFQNRMFDDLGLVRLEHLARRRRLSPDVGRSLG